jgi:small subunit ribosomal protein S16
MAVKIRLARVGRHKTPFYRIVAADSRSPRDGRYVEQIGHYDPSKQPQDAVINEELAIKWLKNGAQLSDTVRTLFTQHGLIAKWHASKKEGK